MRRLTMGLVVVGLVLVCSQAFGKEEKTLEEWGFPPTSQWVFHDSSYVSDDGDGLKGTVCETYLVPPSLLVPYGIFAAYKYPDEAKWCKICVPTTGAFVVFEDYDHDGLWAQRLR